MLARANRLRQDREFNRVYRAGRQFSSPLVGLYALPRTGNGPRFGIAVSKKVGGAVQRNLVKRRLREACRGVMKDLAPSFDFVLVARPAALEADFIRLSRSVSELIERAAKEGSSCGRTQQKEAPHGPSGRRRP